MVKEQIVGNMYTRKAVRDLCHLSQKTQDNKVQIGFEKSALFKRSPIYGVLC